MAIMKIEIDDDFADEIVRATLAESYVSVSGMLKNPDSWHEDDVAAWKELLPAIKVVGTWFSANFETEIKNAKKKK
jgi:hypothetical protein